jgi:serine/threonine protein kinase
VGEAAEFATDKTGHGVGTPAYTAPETWLQLSAYPTVDLYAVGAILYQMLTGQVPNNSDPNREDKKKDKKKDKEKEQTMREVMERTIRGDYHDPNDFDGVQIDDGLRQILWGLLAQPVAELKEGEAQQFFNMIYSFSGVKLRDSAGRIVLATGNIRTSRVKLLKRSTTDELIRNLEAWTEKQSGKEGSLRKGPAPARPVRASDPTVALRRPRPNKSFSAYILGAFLAAVAVAILIFALRPRHSDPTDSSNTGKQGKTPVTTTTPPNSIREPVKVTPTQPDNQDSTTLSYGSMEFDGKNDYIDVGDSKDFDFSDELTVAWWMKHERFISGKSIISRHLQETDKRSALNIGIIVPPGKILVEIPYGPRILISQVVPIGTWHHYAVVKSGNEWSLYKDGSLWESAMEASLHENIGKLYVGAIFGKEVNYKTDAKLSHMQWFNKAKTEEQIKELVLNPGADKDGLQGHWLGAGAAKEKDLSGKGHHGVIHGNPRVVKDGPPIRKRSELRIESEKAPADKLNMGMLVGPSRLSHRKGFLILRYDPRTVQSFVDEYLPQNTGVLFVANRSELRNALARFGHLKEIYGFSIVAANAEVDQLRAGDPELNNIERKAHSAFGPDLGIPVILLPDGSLRSETRAEEGVALSQEFLQNARAIRLRYDPRFIRDSSYQNAYLLAASALSRSELRGPAVAFKGNDLVFTKSYLDSIIQNLDAIVARLRSA